MVSETLSESAKTRGCPLCGSEETLGVKSLCVEPIVEEWKRTFSIDVRSEFDGLFAFEMRACQDCKLQYFAPESLAGSPNLYAQLEQWDWYYMPRKWEHDIALRDLNGCKKVLEVGCGFGDFIARVRGELGVDIEGIEENPRAVSKAEGRGLPVQLEGLEKRAVRIPGRYDAICAFQVLEHVPTPGAFLKACCALLRRGGKLLLGLPNADSFLRYQFNVLDLPPHHMSRWCMEVASGLPKSFPLTLEDVRLEPLAEYHVDGYVDAYLSGWGHGILGRVFPVRMHALLRRVLKNRSLRHMLRGQTLYASYCRV